MEVSPAGKSHKHSEYHQAVHTLTLEIEHAISNRSREAADSLQTKLDDLAAHYQDDAELGTDRDKLYIAQALIHRLKGDTRQAEVFIGAAEEVHGGPFAAASRVRAMLGIGPGSMPGAVANAGLATQGSVDMQSAVIASAGKRLLTYIVDIFVYYALLLVVSFCLGIFIGVMGMDSTLVADANGDPSGWMYLLSFGVFFGYFTYAETKFGQTIGKRIAGTRVVSADGTPVTVRQVLIRTLARFIPFDSFSFIFDKRPVGWHDKIPGVRVIETK